MNTRKRDCFKEQKIVIHSEAKAFESYGWCRDAGNNSLLRFCDRIYLVSKRGSGTVIGGSMTSAVEMD